VSTIKRILALIFIIAGILMLGSLTGYIIIEQRVNNPTAAALPQSIDGFPLSLALHGSEAVHEIYRLHGKDFLLTSGSVGVYGNMGQITLWITGTPLNVFATRLINSMETKIDEGDSPFTPVAERYINNRKVYELDGIGQKHFYFQSGRYVIWLAADEEFSEGVLISSLEFYP
jgi:hypothetical protein